MSAAPSSPQLSVIVIARNEARRLPTCLASVAFADEVIVVDGGSTDDTAEIARRAGARVIEAPDWPGFGPQKQRALDAARGEWVLSLDADEWVDEDLAAAVQRVARGGDAPHAASAASGALPVAPERRPAVYRVDRLSAFCGQWMRGGSWYPDPVPRLFRRGQARFSDDRVHERLLFEGVAGVLPGLLLHNSIDTLHDALDKMNRYSSGRADDLRRAGRRGGLGRAIGHGLWAFVRSYLLRRGFRDGRLGLVLALLDSHATYYRHLKLWLPDTRPPHRLPHPHHG